MNADQIHTEIQERPVGVPGNGDGFGPLVDAAAGAAMAASRIDTEVPAKATRRRHSAEYKKAILQEADRCTKKGEIGALLRREGLYSQQMTAWRREREAGILAGLGSSKRGPKSKRDPKDMEIRRLQRENDRLKRKLNQAEAIIDVQKKISDLLGIPQPERIDGETS